MHPEWTMVMYSTGKAVGLNDYKETIGKVVVSGKLIREVTSDASMRMMASWFLMQLLLPPMV